MRNRQKLVRAIVGVTPVLAVAGMTPMASAATPVFPNPDSFNYTTGSLTGQGPWVRAAGIGNPTVINVSSSANLTNPFAQMPPSTGGAVTIDGVGNNSGGTDRDPFGVATSTGTVYYSFLLDVNALTGATTAGDFFISLNNTVSGSQTNNPSVVPAKIGARVDPTDSTKYDLGIFGNGEALTAPNWSSGLTVGTGVSTTHLVVGAYTITQTGGGPVANTSSLWIDPDPTSFGLGTAPAATITSTGGNATTIGSILLRQSAAPFLTLDELRVGTTWGSVTPTLSAYFDVNGAAAGSGVVASTTYNWEDAAGFWNADSTGASATGAFPGSAYTAVFSAGSDGTSAYTVNISNPSGETCAALSVEEGSPTFTGNAVTVTNGRISVATGSTAQFNNTLNAGTNFVVASGSGTTFGGSVVLNTAAVYSGTTTISNATLQIGTGTTTGSIPAASVITDNGALVFDRSDTLTQGTNFDSTSAGISGTGNVVQAGAGNLILNVPNTYSGTTIANAGSITITHSLGAQNSTIDTSGAGSIVFDNSLTSITVGGLTGATNLSANPNVSITLDGTVRSTSFGGAISGNGSLTAKLGPSNFQSLYGTNTYTGGTTISSGMLQFNTLTSMPAIGTVAALKGGTLSVRAGGAGEWTNSTNTSTPGTIGSLIAGIGGQGSPVTWAAGSTLGISTLNSGGSLTYAGNIAGFNTGSGTTDEVGLHKTGSDTTLTLTSASNTFSGPVSVDNDGGILALQSALPNAGQSFADYGQTVPTATIGTATGTATDGSQDTGIKILTNNALPSNTLISFGSSVNGADATSSLLQLYDAFAATGQSAGTSFNQTIRGITGGSGRVKVGLGTLTINVPTGESYSFTGTVRTDNNGSTHGVIIKDGPGEQDINSDSSSYTGDFWLKNGTIGLKDGTIFGSGTANAFIISGGTFKNLGNAGLTLQMLNIQLGGNFTVDINGGNNTVTNASATVTLTSNSTINVIDSTGGVFSFQANIKDNGNNFGITKTGPGVFTLGARSDGTQNNYGGDTNIQQGELRVVAGQLIGNGSSNANLQGGQLAFNGTNDPMSGLRTLTVANPLHVSADSTIAYDSTSSGLTDVTDPTGIQFIFSSNTFDQTAGKLTFSYLDTVAATTVTFRPQFTGSGFTYGGAIEVDNGATGTHPTVLGFMNSSGTQTFNGNFTGTGSISRGTGGNTVLGGQLVSVGGVSVANSSSIQLAHSAASTRVIKTANLTIGTTSSQLDLTNNKMIVTGITAGAWNGSAYSGITGLVKSGQGTITAGQPAWNGSGIVTSEAAATTSTLTTLAVAAASDAKGISGTQTALFGGQTVHATDALVMYTYAGDANLDGKIDADDYFQIDSHYNKTDHGSKSYFDGDFNYDGQINGDDYFLIDSNFHAQGAAFSPGEIVGAAGVQAVPEPVGLSAILLGVGIGSRRRRSTKLTAGKRRV